MGREWSHKVFATVPASFEEQALEVFRFQYRNNELYRAFAEALGKTPATVASCTGIPFLPIQFFKSHAVTSTAFSPELVFESSGTTGQDRSRHLIKEYSLYRTAFTTGFRHSYGDPEDWCIIGLLPSYLERKNSSLVVMVDELIKLSRKPESGFYLHEYEKLHGLLEQLEEKEQKTWLIGVSFALLDFARQYPASLKNTVIVETGGMKGRKTEMVRQELHELLRKGFGVEAIHSEYGMTELLSQAYSSGTGIFRCPPWMKVLIRGEDDPLAVRDNEALKAGETVSGLINVIDLANIYSCSFIATDDAGKLYQDGSFEVAGRMDHSDIRGCSLLVV